MAYVVRVVSTGGRSATTRDTTYATKREALDAISRLGALSSIVKLESDNTPGRIYVVTPKGNR